MVNRFKSFIKTSALYKSLVMIGSKIILPGFGGISIYETALHFKHGLNKGSLPTRAAALSYNFFLALFPSVIFLFTLIPYIPIDNFQWRLLEAIRMFMPANAYEATEETINEIITQPNGGLLSLGFLMALYFSTNGFNSIINSFNNSYHDVEKRKPLMQRFISLLMVVISTSTIILGIGTLVAGEYLINHLGNEAGNTLKLFLLDMSKWLALFMLCWILISTMYYLSPARRSRGWRFFSPGSLMATLLSIATSLGFAYFVNNFGTYNKVYGSLGTLIVVMIWIYLNAVVLLVGFEINASIHTAKRKKVLGLN